MKNKRIAALIASLGLAAMAYTAVPVNAGAAEGYEPVHGGTYSFDKYLVLKNDATVPNVSFNFSVKPADVEDETALPGPAGIKFTADAGTDVRLYKSLRY